MLVWVENTIDPNRASDADIRIATNTYGSWDAYKQWYSQQIIGEPISPTGFYSVAMLKSIGYVGVYRKEIEYNIKKPLKEILTKKEFKLEYTIKPIKSKD